MRADSKLCSTHVKQQKVLLVITGISYEDKGWHRLRISSVTYGFRYGARIDNTSRFQNWIVTVAEWQRHVNLLFLCSDLAKFRNLSRLPHVKVHRPVLPSLLPLLEYHIWRRNRKQEVGFGLWLLGKNNLVTSSAFRTMRGTKCSRSYEIFSLGQR